MRNHAIPQKPQYRNQRIYELEDAGRVTAEPEEALVSRLRATLQSPTYQPPLLPEAAVRLYDLTRKSSVAFSTIQEVLDTEPMLTASVLRLAQSAFYRRAEPVRTVEQAMRLLGLRTLADLFLQVSTTSRIFRAPGFDLKMKQLQAHSVATAHVARLVCEARPAPAEHAFLAGLLHDVGAAAGILVLAESEPGKVRTLQENDTIVASVLHAHEWSGEVLARAWRLPDAVVPALSRHHSLDHDGRVDELAAAVCLADHLVQELGVGFGEAVPAEQRLCARVALRLTTQAEERLVGSAREMLDRLRDPS